MSTSVAYNSNTEEPSRPSLNLPFLGTSRTINDKGKLLTRPLDNDEIYVLDTNAVHQIPKEKAACSIKWDWRPKGTESEIKLEQTGFSKIMKNLPWGLSGSVTDVEIHMIYLPHLPIELYREHNITIGLYFDGSDGDSELLSQAIFPSPLHTHIIFYPGHSFSTRTGSKFPWTIKISTSAGVSENYNIADIILRLKGYNTPLSYYSSKSGADIISLVPAVDIPTGITLTRPRGNNDWIIKGLRYGIKNQKSMRTLQMLQEAGIDVEGLQMVGKLKCTLNALRHITNRKSVGVDINQQVRKTIMPLLQ
ncbi:34K protein 3 [Zostera-associated varicosavirus 1]|uniref:34K protein 3 n=1 Tax=Zostera-associated varicosavirus 1 TaxID=3071325 RepID=UPI001E6B8847|nr:34K protein 3 [Zostera-associated varicosavirus 1]DAZ85731.1 TPA_asm: 34K protein 3 [Zostera-associated varicosavirus 1]